MSRYPTRRQFLRTAATVGGAAAALEFAPLQALSPATAGEAKVTPELVRFGPDIEPVVREIEQAPQETCIPVMIEQLRRGLPYRQFMAALYLAAIRAAKWHGSIHGYDHNTYLVHSAHQLTLDLPPAERLLPAFYALNAFKGMQKVYPGRPGTPELTGKLPPAEKAADELDAALRDWEPERAERAIVALARTAGTSQVLEPLWRYAGRDWGFIGHMAILVSSSCRLLETIGWQHAEPVLRYVVAGLAGWGKGRDREPDVLPYWANLERARRAGRRLPGDWAGSEGSEGLTRDLVASVRDGRMEDTCDLAVRQLVQGKAQAGAVWDAVHLAAGELVVCSRPFRLGAQTNGDALHANTAANALHHAFRASPRRDTRLLLTLQALAWLHLFRDLTRRKELLTGTTDLTRLTGAELPDSPEAAAEAILATRTAQPLEAGRLAFSLARRHPVGPLLTSARRLLPLKSTGDPHDIKFPVAILEDLDRVSRGWRPHLLAAAVYSFRGSDRPDNAALQQVREALRVL